MPKPGFLPLPLLTLGVFLLVLGLVWGLPLLQGESVSTTTFGDPKTQTFSCRSNHEVNYTWTGEVSLSREQAHSGLLPRLPFAVASQSGPDPGTCTLYMDMTVYVNEKVAYASYGRFFVDPPSAGGGFTADRPDGEPLALEDLFGEFQHVGSNAIRFEVEFRLRPTEPGTTYFDWKGGPLWVETHHADRDGDKIPDDDQPLPGVHTAWIAVPLALLCAATVHWILDRRRQAR